MNAQDIFLLLIKDLIKIKAVCRHEHLEKVPDIAMDYLAANHDLIRFYLKQVYTKIDDAQRGKLSSEHSNLHYSVVGNFFYEIAELAIKVAECWANPTIQAVPLARSLTFVTEDDFDMLVRALEYAKYCPLDAHNYTLKMSPIEKYGLKNHVNDEGEGVYRAPQRRHSLR
ncbi:hypothetical protein HYR99_05365 [Candidatus Poribacteria bacterium]|nr:hypothetical protein [Candidatus Poribacteria bacterium]